MVGSINALLYRTTKQIEQSDGRDGADPTDPAERSLLYRPSSPTKPMSKLWQAPLTSFAHRMPSDNGLVTRLSNKNESGMRVDQ